MRRALAIFVFVALAGSVALAQFTTVTGTVTDPNGLAYANGTIAATLVTSASPTLNGFAYTPPTQPTGLNLQGSFTMRLADNTQLSPGGTTWNFQVCSALGTVQPVAGKGPICFSVTGVTISGASQSITATLAPAALALSNSSGIPSGDITLTGNLLFSPTDTYYIGGPTGLFAPHKIMLGNGILIAPDTGSGATAMGVLTAQANYLLVKAETPVSGSYEPGCQFLSNNSGLHGAVQCLLAQGFGGSAVAADATAGWLIGINNSGTQTDSWLVNNQGINNEDHLNQGSWNDLTGAASQSNRTGGTCAMSAGTTCTFTLVRAFTATPICIVTAQGTNITGGAAACSVSGTTVTITAAAANSNTWGALLVGNPN